MSGFTGKTASQFFLAALAHVALSLKTAEFLSQLENGNWRVKSPEVLDGIFEFLADVLLEGREEQVFARAA